MRVCEAAAVLLLAAVASIGAGGALAAQQAASEIHAPTGFTVTLFDDGVGANARHLAVRANGDVLIAREDGTLIALRDADGDGRAERREDRSLPIETGLAIHRGYLYFSNTTSVSRVRLDAALMPAGAVETVVSGFPEQGVHQAKPLVFDAEGNLYVNVGAPSNACQERDRVPGSPGQKPCRQLEQHAGLWRFPAGATGLTQAQGTRFVTGTRNVVAMDYDPASAAVYFVMHGRDQLDSLWPERFDANDNAEMPAEEFHRAVAGADYGWPYTYYDPRTNRRLIAPEYGGDGITEARPGRYREPLYAFPAHWAPNDMLFYGGTAFPERYRGGVFIAWHGSWNRAPLPQEGYRVTFLPFADGSPAGPPEDFLTGFQAPGGAAGADGSDTHAAYRPTGLAEAPDGSLYITETARGRVWRVAPRS